MRCHGARLPEVIVIVIVDAAIGERAGASRPDRLRRVQVNARLRRSGIEAADRLRRRVVTGERTML
jgi:hypothetical protein